MIPHERISAAAIQKTKEKDGFYGMDDGGPEAWQTMEILSLAKAAQYKIDRAMQPGTVLQKKLDDLEDAYNFIAAIYERVLG